MATGGNSEYCVVDFTSGLESRSIPWSVLPDCEDQPIHRHNHLCMESSDTAAPSTSVLNVKINSECHICFENTLTYETQCCEVKFCFRCFDRYVSRKVGEEFLDIQCPGYACPKIMNITIIQKIVNSNLSKILDYLWIKDNRCKVRKVCPNCSIVLSLEKHVIDFPETDQSAVICSKCLCVWCLQCRASWHEGVTCEEHRESTVNTGLEEGAILNRTGEDRNAQMCPECSTFVEQVEGSFLMTCTECYTKFCYDCGVQTPHPTGSVCQWHSAGTQGKRASANIVQQDIGVGNEEINRAYVEPVVPEQRRSVKVNRSQRRQRSPNANRSSINNGHTYQRYGAIGNDEEPPNECQCSCRCLHDSLLGTCEAFGSCCEAVGSCCEAFGSCLGDCLSSCRGCVCNERFCCVVLILIVIGGLIAAIVLVFEQIWASLASVAGALFLFLCFVLFLKSS